MKKSSLVAIMLIAMIATMFTGCKSDETIETSKSYEALELSDIAMHRDRGDIKVTKSNTPNQETSNNDKSDNLDVGFNSDGIVEQEGNDAYVTKFGYSQLNLEGKDTTEYFEISGDDIIYGDVTYIGLNKVLDSIEYPYDKTTLINFIVKTYDPMDKTVSVSCTIADDDGYVDGWSMGMNDSLADAWPDYIALREKYGKIVKWEIMLADKETYDRQSYMYGCSDYMIYLSYTSGETIDMSNFEDIKPD